MDDVLTTTEAAAFLKVGVDAVRDDTHIPFRLIAGKRRYLKDDLIEFIREGYNHPVERPHYVQVGK